MDDIAESSVEEVKKAAELGNFFAQYRLAQMYREKYTAFEYNLFKSIAWFKKSAAQGYTPAQVSLGDIYSQEDSEHEDYSKAIDIYKLAADQGNVKAIIKMAYMYENGLGGIQNLEVSLQLLQKASDLGSKQAIIEFKRLENKITYRSRKSRFANNSK